MNTTKDNEFAVKMVYEISVHLRTKYTDYVNYQTAFPMAIEIAKYRELQEINKNLDKIAGMIPKK